MPNKAHHKPKPQGTELTDQERQFVSYYAKTGNGPESVRQAYGAKQKNPREKAYRLLRTLTLTNAITAERERLKAEALAREAAQAAQASRTRRAALDKVWLIAEAMEPANREDARLLLQAVDRLARAEGWDAPTEHRSIVRHEVQTELCAALYEAARLEVGEEAARRIVLRLAGEPVDPAGRVLAAEYEEPGE